MTNGKDETVVAGRAGGPAGRDRMILWLREAIAAALDAPLATVATDVPISELGLDSVEAVILTGRLEEWLGREVRPELFFEEPTIEQIADDLLGRTGAGG